MTNRRTFLKKPLDKLKRMIKESDQPNDVSAEKNFRALMSDFTSADLQSEMMRMDIDPANLSEDQMLEIIYTKMASKNEIN